MGQHRPILFTFFPYVLFLHTNYKPIEVCMSIVHLKNTQFLSPKPTLSLTDKYTHFLSHKYTHESSTSISLWSQKANHRSRIIKIELKKREKSFKLLHV